MQVIIILKSIKLLTKMFCIILCETVIHIIEWLQFANRHKNNYAFYYHIWVEENNVCLAKIQKKRRIWLWETRVKTPQVLKFIKIEI
jgi:hypothetical protein